MAGDVLVGGSVQTLCGESPPTSVSKHAIPEKPRQVTRSPALSTGVVSVAVVALFFKLAIAYTTFGTNDVVTFYSFARSLSEHGLEWTYRHGVVWLSAASIFNHPPVTSYLLRGVYHLAEASWFRSNGLTFPFLWRLPGIIADFIVVLLLLRLWQPDRGRHRYTWALILFAVSPASLMVTGYHGNTDPLMVMFLVGAACMAVWQKPMYCGVLFGLSCQIKIVPLLLFPAFFFFWWHRKAMLSFVLPIIVVFLTLWVEPLLNFPALFIRNVISYGSYWGLWGITYWLRMTGFAAFSYVWYEGLSPAQNIVVSLLKILIVAIVFVIGWRRRKLDGHGLVESIALCWIVFFVFSPGVCAQYLIWPAPFVLLLSPKFYGWVTAASSIFLFFFYNIISHGLPWYLGVSTNQLNTIWTPWSVWPWAVFISGILLFWRSTNSGSPGLSVIVRGHRQEFRSEPD